MSSTSTGNEPVVYYSNFVPLDQKTLGPFVTGWVLVAWTTAWMVLRFWCRIKILKLRLMLEDWLQLFALFCFYGDVAAYSARAFLGAANYPVEQIQWYHLQRRDKATIALMVMYTVAVTAIKISVVWTLSRIFSQNSTFRLVSYTIMVFSAVLMLTLLLLNVCWCAPEIKILWSCDLSAIQTHCAGPQAALAAEIAMSSLNLFNEIIIFLLPVPMVATLRIGWRYKAGVLCIFGIGGLTLLCAFLRLLFRVYDDWLGNEDHLSSFYASLLLLEPGLGLIAVSSMGMKPVFEIVLAPLLGSLRKITRSGTGEASDGSKTMVNSDDGSIALRSGVGGSGGHGKSGSGSGSGVGGDRHVGRKDSISFLGSIIGSDAEFDHDDHDGEKWFTGDAITSHAADDDDEEKNLVDVLPQYSSNTGSDGQNRQQKQQLEKNKEEE